MSLKIKEMPETERPYEKLELYGEKALSNAELLAIIIKAGTKEETSVQIAQRVLNLNYDPQMGELNFLKEISLEELMQVKGIGRVKAIQLKAVCELAIRMSKPSNYKKVRVSSTSELANLVMEELKLEKKEYVKLVLLNNKCEVLKMVDISKGGTNLANVNIKEILNHALKIQAPRMVLIHNHPTGDPTPSRIDIKLTDRLFNAAKLVDVELMDHIVIGNNNYKSVFEVVKNMVDDQKQKNNDLKGTV